MTLEVQFLSMLASTGTGIWFGASFDTYKRIVGGSQYFRWTLLINDILFWLLQALVFFFVLLKVNHGEIRFYLFLALLLGYSMYRAVFEKAYHRFLEWIIRVVQETIRILEKTIKALVINPTKWLLKLLATMSMIVLTTLWRIVQLILSLCFYPIRWLAEKYVQAFGIPFYSFYKKIILLFKKIKYLWGRWFKKDDE